MSTLDSILDLLNKWPAWKRITEAPSKIEQLEARIVELENRLQRAPGEACPKCGALEYRVIKTKLELNPAAPYLPPVPVRTMRCKECGFKETQRVR